MTTMPTVQITSAGFQKIQSGNTVIRKSAIVHHYNRLEPGSTVQVLSPDRTFIGIGYYNDNSKIPLRILTYKDEAINREFWQSRIRSAYEYRKIFYSDTDSYRLIYGEADGFPGLIADWYSGVFVIQITTAGMDKQIKTILPILIEFFTPKAIIFSCDSRSRQKEGLLSYRRIEYGNTEIPFQATIDGIQHWINPLDGHKTGYFLDHRTNRKEAAELCTDRRVLDCFCYSGAFAVQAALGNAASVDAVDIYEPGLELGRLTVKLNKLESTCNFLREEAFQFLKYSTRQNKWDLIFLDPPSLVRGSGRARRNLSNYRKLNRLALECLSSGGILVTSICSYHVTHKEFLDLLGTAMVESGRHGRVFHMGGAGPDHPIYPGSPGTDYLKCYFIRSLANGSSNSDQLINIQSP